MAGESKLVHARKKRAKNCDAETERKRFVGKIDEADEDERTTVGYVAEKNQSEDNSHVDFDRIGKRVGKFKRRTIINIKKQRVANGRTRH